jgi:hypothetical protein
VGTLSSENAFHVGEETKDSSLTFLFLRLMAGRADTVTPRRFRERLAAAEDGSQNDGGKGRDGLEFRFEEAASQAPDGFVTLRELAVTITQNRGTVGVTEAWGDSLQRNLCIHGRLSDADAVLTRSSLPAE